MTHKLIQSLEKIHYGSLKLELPEKKSYFFKGSETGPSADITIHDHQVVLNLVTGGDIAFTKDYMAGLWDTSNLAHLIEFSLLNTKVLDQYIEGNQLLKLASRIGYFFRRNNLSGSKKNILAHYDIGNDFYSLWLDKSMTYSSAIFNDKNQTLEEAQKTKHDRILSKLKPNSQILEIGCGWGSFMKRATEAGHTIKGITLSNDQKAWASEILKQDITAQVVIEDYRHQKEKFDHIVSIEMFEAVGESYWTTYFKTLKACLKDQGSAIVQTITVDNDHFEQYKRSADPIRSLIFPGGMLASAAVFEQYAKKSGLKIVDSYAFGQDYAKTLQHWLKTFDEKKSAILALGMDESFIRLWRFYLGACEGTFRCGRTNVFQFEITHA